MKVRSMEALTFERANTPAEAVAAMGRGAVPVAGGTDLVVSTRQGKRAFPQSIVAIDAIEELRGTRRTSEGLWIGALTTHAQLLASEAVVTEFPAVADASAIVGSHATRAQGTLGGNVMNASPAMDCGAALLCHDATAHFLSPEGKSSVPLAEVWSGPGRTTTGPESLLTGLTLPYPAAASGSAYVRLQYRRQMEIAVVGVAVLVTVHSRQIVDARIAISALSPVIARIPDAEAALLTKTTDDPAAIGQAAQAVQDACAPISDVRASSGYRHQMAAVMFRRALWAACERAAGRSVRVPASDSTFGVANGI